MPETISAHHQPGMPTMPHAQLRGFERVAVPLLEATNRRPAVRRALHFVSGWSFGAVVRAVTGPRWRVFGLEHMQTLTARDGAILAANHRSFFDLYVVSTVLKFHTSLLREVAYPVRSEFFYTHPLGIVLNFAFAGATMWPPVFRDDRRRMLNPIGFQQLASTLGRGCLIGIHPEGTRGKGDDPYAYLGLKPGLGQLVAGCAPGVLVVPVFVGGLSNDVALEVKRSYGRQPRQQQQIRVWFGEPFRADALQPLADPAAMTEQVFARVRALGEADKQWLAMQQI
jgi:1-acyl-sn-glycerol-3-phosphate acyltransferase